MINPFDVSKLRVAGAQLKDGLLPVPMANINVEMRKTSLLKHFISGHIEKIDPAGSYFFD